jgi:hypothetical protein
LKIAVTAGSVMSAIEVEKAKRIDRVDVAADGKSGIRARITRR